MSEDDGQPDEAKKFDKKEWMKIHNVEYHAKWHPRRLKFRSRYIHLKDNPRKGICENCGAIKGIDCKRTNIHHMKYHDNNILKDTIELCVSCHVKKHGLGKRK